METEGRGVHFYCFFFTPPPRLVCTTDLMVPNRLSYRFISASFRVTHPCLKWKIEHAKLKNNVGSIRIKTIPARVHDSRMKATGMLVRKLKF